MFERGSRSAAMAAYERKLAAYETFVPFTDPPTYAQMDFGEATGVLQS